MRTMCQSPRSSERRTAKIDPNGYGSWGLPFLVQHRLPGVHVKRLHFQSGSHGRLPEIAACAVWRGELRAANRLRQCGEPASGTRHDPQERDRYPIRDWGWARAAHSATVDGKRVVVDDGRSLGSWAWLSWRARAAAN